MAAITVFAVTLGFGAVDGRAEPPTDDEAALRLRTVLIRDRAIERDLARAEKEAAAGRTVEAVRLLQGVLDRDEDCFLWRPDRPHRPQSGRGRAEELLVSLGDEGRQVYQDLSDAAAAELLREADRTGDSALYGEVARRFVHTSAGVRAIDRLAAKALSQGDVGAAARLIRRMLGSSASSTVMQPAHWRRALAVALARHDEELVARARRALAELEPRTDRPRTPPARDERAGVPSHHAPGAAGGSSLPGGARSSEWPTHFGDARRLSVSGASVPAQRPVWQVSLFSPELPARRPNPPPVRSETPPSSPSAILNRAPDDRRQSPSTLNQLASRWQDERWSTLEPPANAPQAIVVSDRVVFRDIHGLRAVTASTGEFAWRYHTPASPLNPVSSEFAALVTEWPAPDIAGSIATSSVLGLLSSDGERVFAVQSHAFLGPKPNQRATGGNAAGDAGSGKNLRNWNQLVALSARGEEGQALNRPLWTLGGLAANAAGDPLKLTGRYFFGPPLPHDGRLFAVVEHDRQISAVSIRAADGEVLWSQGLGYVDRAVDTDEFRMQQVCLPTLLDGVLVCPTNLGYLVALDPDTGSVVWANTCGEEWPDPRFGHSSASRNLLGDVGFPNAVLGAEGHVFTLPHHSEQVRCFDVRNGAMVWSAPRRDGEFLATVTDRHLVVVGRRSCRALDRTDGKPAWTTPTALPAGTGLRVGSQYILPLKTGRVLALDLATGRPVGLGFPVENRDTGDAPTDPESSDDEEAPSTARLGNLVPVGDQILSCGLTRLTAFRGAETALEEATARLAERPNDHALRLELGKLRLTLGDSAGGKADQRAVAASGDAALRAVAEQILRDTLFSELAEPGPNADAVLAELDPLCRDGESHARFLTALARHQASRPGAAGLTRTVRRFLAAADSDEPLPLPSNANHRVAAARSIASQLADFEAASAPGARELDALVAEERAAALSAPARDRLEAFLRVFGHRPEADAVRLKLARIDTNGGRRQSAELLLNACLRSPNRATRAAAVAGLALHYDRVGLFHLGARKLAELETEYAPEVANDAGMIRETLAAVADDSPCWAFRGQFLDEVGPVRFVRIRENRFAGADPQAQRVFGPYRRKFQMPAESGYNVVDRGIQPNSESNRLEVIDRNFGMATGALLVPRSMAIQSPQRPGMVGHFFALGTEGRASGVSLIECEQEAPFWTTTLHSLPAPGEDIVKPGPAGPGFASFQSRQYLAVLDPRDGRILWERADVDQDSNQPDQYGNLYGDDRALVLFTADRGSFAVYRTDDGAEVRQANTSDLGQLRLALGRRLLFGPDGDSEKSVRLWDALTARTLATVPVGDRYFTLTTPADDLVVLAGTAVVWIDGATGETKLNATLPHVDALNVSGVRAFSDRDSLYLVLQREMRSATALNQISPADTFLPALAVNGELIALDRRAGTMRWKRTLGSRSILDFPHHRLPFLVTAAQVRDRQNGNRTSLMIEVIDRATGETVGMTDNLAPTRLVTADVDPQAGRIDLTGLNSLIRLSFPRAHQQPDRDPEARR